MATNTEPSELLPLLPIPFKELEEMRQYAQSRLDEMAVEDKQWVRWRMFRDKADAEIQRRFESLPTVFENRTDYGGLL